MQIKLHRKKCIPINTPEKENSFKFQIIKINAIFARKIGVNGEEAKALDIQP